MSMTFDDLLARARDERNRAIQQVSENAPDEWKTLAWDWFVGFIADRDTYVPDVDNQSCPYQPPQRRAWGALVRRASTAGLIRDSGRAQPRTLGHCSLARIWEVV